MNTCCHVLFHLTASLQPFKYTSFVIQCIEGSHHFFAIYINKEIITQNNLSPVICVAISLSLGWWKDHLSPQGDGDPSAMQTQ